MKDILNNRVPLKQVLAQFRGSRIYFDSPPGNNGDHLIYLGTIELLKKLGIKQVSKPADAEAIFLNGGATMTEHWGGGSANSINSGNDGNPNLW